MPISIRKPLSIITIVFILLFPCVNQAEEYYLVDTGTPSSGQLGYTVSSSQWLAAEFIVDQSVTITSIQGYFALCFDGTDKGFINIYSDSGDLPDTSRILHSQNFTTSGVKGWQGLTEINWSLDPGSYWVAFEVKEPDTAIGGIGYNAPYPLINEAYNSFSKGWVGNDGLNLGIRIITAPVPEPVVIDIKPCSYPNIINTRSRGKIPVAILSTEDFDAPSEIHIDRRSLTFGYEGDERSLAFCNAGGKDVNKDGLKDLVCHFNTRSTAFECGDIDGVLKAQTNDGTLLEGIDSVKITPCKKSK